MTNDSAYSGRLFKTKMNFEAGMSGLQVNKTGLNIPDFVEKIFEHPKRFNSSESEQSAALRFSITLQIKALKCEFV